jgi:hypothetical protein
MSSLVRAVGVAYVLISGAAFPALADDFVNACMTGNPVPDGEKICICMSNRISDSDRAAAIDAMNKTNAAMAKGDTSILTPQVLKTMGTVMSLQAACG